MKHDDHFTTKDLILYANQGSLIPEIYEFLGDLQGTRFLKIFGGIRVDVPPFEKIEKLKRNIEIYETVRRNNTQKTLDQLANKYKITPNWVRNIYHKMHNEYPKLVEFKNSNKQKSLLKLTGHRRVRG